MIDMYYFDGTVKKDIRDWKLSTLIAIANDNKNIQKITVDGEVVFERK